MSSTDISQLHRYFDLVEQYPRRKRGLAIGDSWFQYPLRSYSDLQSGLAGTPQLRSSVNFLDDSYPGRDADEVKGLIKRWIRVADTLQNDYKKPLDLIILSLGGNDVIGLDFGRHLKQPGQSSTPTKWSWTPTVPAVAKNWIKLDALDQTFENIRGAYEAIVNLRNQYAPAATIISHTYAAVTPANVPYTFLTFKAGPWIWKPLNAIGMTASADQKALVAWLLEAFYGLLSDIQSDKKSGRFVVLDTRKELSDSVWDNEIHPGRDGFRFLTQNFWLPAALTALA